MACETRALVSWSYEVPHGYPFRVVEPVVQLREVVSLLAGFPVLAGVDLRVDSSEIVHLRGGNGAGKTSILRLCAGLLRVVDGEGTVLGHDLRSDRRAVRREVGLLAHDTHLYDDLTVSQNVDFWTRAANADPADAAAAMQRLELDGRLADVAVAALSAGQRRRTSLATMLARRPRLWLLDEPHAGLDQQGRDVVDDLIGHASDAGATVLVASHELERAGARGWRQVTIAGGSVVADTARTSREAARGDGEDPDPSGGAAEMPEEVARAT